jgi:hypothetical protein
MPRHSTPSATSEMTIAAPQRPAWSDAPAFIPVPNLSALTHTADCTNTSKSFGCHLENINFLLGLPLFSVRYLCAFLHGSPDRRQTCRDVLLLDQILLPLGHL